MNAALLRRLLLTQQLRNPQCIETLATLLPRCARPCASPAPLPSQAWYNLRCFRGGPPPTYTQTRVQGKNADLTVPIYNLQREQVGMCTLPGDIFDVPVRVDILHRVVRWQRARRQQGTHSTKDRGEVRGGGRKPHQQKGSGRARAGSIRAPHWRGGGVCHGPKPRSHAHDLQRKVRSLGLKCALSAKAFEERLIVVDSLKPSQPKTRLMQAAINNLLAGFPRQSVLLVDSSKEGEDGGAEMRLAARNLPSTNVVPAEGLNVYDMLRRDVLMMSAPGVQAVIERLRRPIKR